MPRRTGDLNKAFNTLVAHAEIDGPHLEDTKLRIERMWLELTQHALPFEFTTFPNADHYDQMASLAGIRFSSWCAHHVLPFWGTAAVGYIPKREGRICGLSKLARTVVYFSKTLQTQERLTKQIGDFLLDKLEPLGVAVVIKAVHSCVIARGAEQPDSMFTTSYMRGVFLDVPEARAEFLEVIKNG